MRLESLWNFYNEHAAQARQHEDQREHMTNILLVIAGALITFVSSKDSISIYSFLAAVSLVPLGFLGWAFSYKHYERNRLHATIMLEIRKAIDDELAQRHNLRTLSELRDDGEELHYRDFPVPTKQVQLDATSRVARKRLNPFWSAIPLLVAVLGIVFATFLGYDLWCKP